MISEYVKFNQFAKRWSTVEATFGNKPWLTQSPDKDQSSWGDLFDLEEPKRIVFLVIFILTNSPFPQCFCISMFTYFQMFFCLTMKFPKVQRC